MTDAIVLQPVVSFKMILENLNNILIKQIWKKKNGKRKKREKKIEEKTKNSNHGYQLINFLFSTGIFNPVSNAEEETKAFLDVHVNAKLQTPE